MVSFNRVTCPVTAAMQAAITSATSCSLTMRIRPTWTANQERCNFGVFQPNPTTTQGRGPYLDCISTRTASGIFNAFGVGWMLDGSSIIYGGNTPSPVAAPDEWFDLGATVDVVNDPVARIWIRADESEAWTQVAQSAGGAQSGTLGVYGAGTHLYLGNRRSPTNVDEIWPGGIAAASFSLGVGAGHKPGGTEIAEWHATPPDPTYTDAYGNTWTVTGPDWSWSSTA